ncbi:MAG: tetratricopeptide repeat protein, partial [Pyrinomonadaceae bacterium]
MRNEIKKNRLILKKLLPVSTISLFVLLSLSCFSNQTTDPNRLVKGTPVTRNIVNDEIHSYTVALEKDQYLELAVEQHDVDVITKVFAPGGELIGEFDTPTSGRGTERIRFGTDPAGEYRVDIYTLSARAEPGEYKLEFADFRPITTRDKQTLAAVKLHQQADILRSKPETMRDSLPVYEQALAIWRELGEKADEGNTLRAMGFAFQRLGEPEKAKEYFGKALEIWEQTGDVRSAAFTHIIFGVIAKKQNDFEIGLKEDLIAQMLWEKVSDQPEAAQNLVRI